MARRPEVSQPVGVWRTDAGALNQIIAIWTGRDDEEVLRTSSEALSTLEEMRVGQRRLDLSPAPFSPALLPRRLGAFYEFRFYTFKPRSFAGIMDRWQGTIGRRLEYSPLLGVWCAEQTTSDELVHAWAYKDANEWQSVRQEVIAKGIWPPPATAELLAASYSSDQRDRIACLLFSDSLLGAAGSLPAGPLHVGPH